MSTRPSPAGVIRPINAGTYHLHIGLGHLGVGLVLGLVRPDVPIVILQRDSDNWTSRRKRLDGEVCEFTNHFDLKNRPFRLHWAKDRLSEVEGIIARSLSSKTPESFVIIYSDLDEMSWVTKYISTVTTAVGPGQDVIGKWLERPDIMTGLHVYPFENKITLKSSQHTIFKVVPDRICGATIDYPQRYAPNRCSTHVEHHTDVIMAASDELAFRIFVPDGVTIIHGDELYEHYRSRKRYLVNAVHHVVAVFGYEKLDAMRVAPEDLHAQHIPIVAEAILNDGSNVSFMLGVLIGAQAMRLVIQALELSADSQNAIFRGRNPEQEFLSLIEYGQQSVRRFRMTPDRMSRVLKPESYAKFLADHSEHVNGLHDFIRDYREEVSKFGARLRPWFGDIDGLLTRISSANMNRLIGQAQSGRKGR